MSKDQTTDDKKNTQGVASSAPSAPVAPPNEEPRVFYFKSNLAGLIVNYGKSGGQVRFVPYLQRVNGDPVRVGYLSTDVKGAAEACRADSNIQEIDEAEYSKATEDEGSKVGY